MQSASAESAVPPANAVRSATAASAAATVPDVAADSSTVAVPPGSTEWTTRVESEADIADIRRLVTAAFPTADEAALVDALREDPAAWIDGFSVLSLDPTGVPTGHALLTRCHVGEAPALALAPCSVPPNAQRLGAGAAAIRAVLAAAREAGEGLVLVLGHADYYPRFGFVPASGYAIRAPFDVPDEAMMALVLDPTRPVPSGTIRWAPAFGV